jgi:hypothetical protein
LFSFGFVPWLGMTVGWIYKAEVAFSC